jgi:hypothetical protein
VKKDYLFIVSKIGHKLVELLHRVGVTTAYQPNGNPATPYAVDLPSCLVLREVADDKLA